MSKDISTEIVKNHLLASTNLNDFFSQHNDIMISDSLPDFLNGLLHKNGGSIADLISKTQLSKSFLYKIFSGEKNPTRDKLLQVIFALSCDEDDARGLLACAGHSSLYAKIKRDSVLLFALNHSLNVYETNNLLIEHDESPLFNLY